MELLIGIAFIIGIAFVIGKCMPQGNGKAVATKSLTAAQQEQLNKWVDSCTGNFEPPRMICGPLPTGLDGDEQVLAVFPDVNLIESRAVRYSRGAYAGPSIRLAKGVSFRLAGSAGHSESVEEQRTIDCGTLLLTTKRLAFIGSIRTSSTDLDDLISVTPYLDGVGIHRERKQKAETYALTRPLVIADGGGQGLPVNGNMMKAAITTAKSFHEIGGPKEWARLRSQNTVPATVPTLVSSSTWVHH